MGTLYIDMPADEADAFVEATPGFELVPGAVPGEAIYGDTRIDAPGAHSDLYDGARVGPRQATKRNPAPAPKIIEMPKPYPTIIGYDGMPRGNYVGVAMKAASGRWVPVTEFDPPLTEREKDAAVISALGRYQRRCAEVAP